MEHIYNTNLWVAKVEDNQENYQVRKVPGISSDFIVAQPIWSPCGKSIIFVAQKRYLRRIGHIYCTNRASALYQIEISDLNDLFKKDFDISSCNSPIILTENCEEDFGARFHSFSPDGNSLIYHTFASSCAHSSCSRLRKIKWSKENDKKEEKRK